MKALCTLLFLCLTVCTADAQSSNSKIKYQVWVHVEDQPKALKGVLASTQDSTIQFIEKAHIKRKKVIYPNSPLVVPISSIRKIQVRKRSNVANGVWLGALGGVIAGAVIGYASGDDSCPPGSWCIFQLSAEEKAAAGGVLGIAPGMIVGAILGSGKKTVLINGDQTLYTNAREQLRGFVHQQQ